MCTCSTQKRPFFFMEEKRADTTKAGKNYGHSFIFKYSSLRSFCVMSSQVCQESLNCFWEQWDGHFNETVPRQEKVLRNKTKQKTIAVATCEMNTSLVALCSGHSEMKGTVGGRGWMLILTIWTVDYLNPILLFPSASSVLGHFPMLIMTNTKGKAEEMKGDGIQMNQFCHLLAAQLTSTQGRRRLPLFCGFQFSLLFLSLVLPGNIEWAAWKWSVGWKKVGSLLQR